MMDRQQGSAQHEASDGGWRIADSGWRMAGVAGRGRRPPASAYSPDLSKHYALGSDPSLKRVNLEYREEL